MTRHIVRCPCCNFVLAELIDGQATIRLPCSRCGADIVAAPVGRHIVFVRYETTTCCDQGLDRCNQPE